jgi:hypothetical protein
LFHTPTAPKSDQRITRLLLVPSGERCYNDA